MTERYEYRVMDKDMTMVFTNAFSTRLGAENWINNDSRPNQTFIIVARKITYDDWKAV